MACRVAAVIGVLGLVLVSPAPVRGSEPSPKAVAAPVQVVHVSWGVIGYRAVGHGRALVLLAGSSGSIDDWSPMLVDRLATGARVYAMDYEGTGRTSLRPQVSNFTKRLTIPSLADDTADFIRALHLGRVDVMGWSMGTFVAQALAIRHPTLVRRLVLASTALGDGAWRAPKWPAHVDTSYPDYWLFPLTAKGRAAAIAYDRAIRSYPDYAFEERIAAEHPTGNQAIASLGEEGAVQLWLHGAVREGRVAAKVKVPVLIGEGTQDVILGLAGNERAAKTIPHATLKLYPDAGHGFLFQHEADWTRLVLRFLSSR